MKKTKAISLLLSLSLMVSLAMPGTFGISTYAADTYSDSDKLVLSKTAEKDEGSDTYTITLEAYATGKTTTTTVQKKVPTDIVLVLDQSGSMDDAMAKGTKGYREYLNKNSTYYTRRHDGGKGNLYYRPSAGDDYFPVYVERQRGTYIEYSKNSTNGDYFNNSSNLFTKEHEKVTLTTSTWYGGTYTYTFPDGYTVESDSRNGIPEFGDRGPLYYYSNQDYTYTYTYKDKNGESKTIGTSNGSSTEPNFIFYEYAEISRRDALKTAVTRFADNVHEKAIDTELNHRVAVVGFASNGVSQEKWMNSEVFVGSNQYNYNENAEDYYEEALQDMRTSAGYNNVIDSKNALAARGATFPDLGLKMAKGIFEANPVPEGQERNRVVVLFTDGQPGRQSFEGEAAKAAIEDANALKAAGVTVYSVGIFAGADANSAGSENSNNDIQKANWFMQTVSSNNGSPQTPSYYLSAADAETLNRIFDQISENVSTGGTTITLDAESVIKDTISPYFQIPKTGANITLKTARYKGGANWEEAETATGVSYSINGDVLEVTGFDFSDNWCGILKDKDGRETPHGKKIQISFKVEPKPGFLGGNGVPTNDENAGVCTDEAAAKRNEYVGRFDVPDVDVEIKDITVNVPDKDVYLLDSVSVSRDNLNGIAYVGGEEGVSLDLSKTNFDLERWQYDFVKINVDITNGNKEDITTDSDYTVSVSIEPTAKKSDDETKTGAGTGKIKVYTPYLTFNDGEVWYGGDVPTDTELNSNLAETKWYHVNGEDKEEANSTTMGKAPDLTLGYKLDASNDKVKDGKINTKKDVPVDVSVTLKDRNVSEYTTFQHNDCTGKTCTLPENYEFLLHIKTCQLTITKNGGVAGEPYVFTVKRNGDKYSEVTLATNGSVTIYELPVGTYTIEEDTGWSWRYTPSYKPESVILAASTPENQLAYTGKITCTNEKIKDKDKWLNGFSDVVTNILGKSHTKGGEK